MADGGAGGEITINGGEITVKFNSGAGIGGGNEGAGGNVVITGGKIKAASIFEPDCGPGIGCGLEYTGNEKGTLSVCFDSGDDFLYARSYTGTVKVEDKKDTTRKVYVKDENNNFYTGALNATQISAIAGQKLTKATEPYTVTVTQSQYATVTASPTLAEAGTKIVISISNVTTGYELDTLTYTPEGGSATAITKDTSGKYTFTMPAANVTVMATFITEWSALQQAINNAADNTTIKVSDYAGDDKTITAASSESALSIPIGKTVTLDLDGCTLDRGLTSATSSGYVIKVDGVLTLKDTSTAQTGTITGGYINNSGGGVFVKGTFNMEGGTITGNHSAFGGGGVYVLYSSSGPTFNLSGGRIVNNISDSNGGGVYNVGNIIMSGGEISGNSTTRGGGVYNRGEFSLSGGRITDNRSTGKGGGVYNNGTFNLSGNPTISGNTSGSDNNAAGNVYLSKANDTQCVITVTGELKNTTPIGVAMETPGVFTSGLSGKGTASKFSSDSNAYAVRLTDDGEAKLASLHTVTLSATNGTVTASVGNASLASGGKAAAGDTVTLTVTPATGYELDTLTVTKDDTSPAETVAVTQGTGDDANKYTFTMPAKNVTVTATFRYLYALVYDPGEGGTGTMAGETVYLGEEYTFPACTFTAPEHKTFDHWKMTGVDGMFYPDKPGYNTVEIATNCVDENGVITVTAYWKDAGAATVKTAPTALNPTYNGGNQALVSAGTAEGGAMSYALGSDASTAPTSGWSADVPTAVNYGTYYVWYKAAGDAAHSDSAAACVTAGIGQKAVTVTARAQTIREGGAIQTGAGYATLTDAVNGLSLSAVTLTADADAKTITPSAAAVQDADKNDVTGNYNISYAAGDLTVLAKTSATVTFKVVNGSWNDETLAAEHSVTLAGYEGDTLKLTDAQIPTAGNKPNDTYKAGSWDTTPSTETAFANGSTTTYTYTYAKKDSISATVIFKVVNGGWNDAILTGDQAVTLTGYEGDTLKLTAAQIPAVGNNPDDTYKAGSWDTVPNTETVFTPGTTTTYTYTYVKQDLVTYTVTFKVINGEWNKGGTGDKNVTLSRYENEDLVLRLTETDIPQVGDKPYKGYKAGAWDVTPTAGMVISGDTVFTYTYAPKDGISQTVTFKVVNGSWDDGTTADKTVILIGLEGETLRLAANQIPAVGNKPNENFKAGSWDVVPSTEAEITAPTTYTYTYAPKDSISQTVTFKVVNGSWDDGTTADKTVILIGLEGETLRLAANQIPAVGNKPNENFKAGSWDVTPNTETAITAPATYTYTYAPADIPVVYTDESEPNQDHRLNSGSDLTFLITRSPEDEKAYSMFDSALVDGNNLAVDTDCEIAPRSLILTLKAAYLDTLATGEHTLTVLFIDGKVDTTFTVSKEIDPTNFDDVAVPSDTFTFWKEWQGASEKSIDFTLYKIGGSVYHHGFDKKVISDRK